jgi:hypothetical protein
MTLIHAIRAKLASSTHGSNPLDACAVTNLPTILHVRSNGDDDAGAFVASDAVRGGLHVEGPFVVEEGFVGGAEARVVDFDKDLVWGGELQGDVLDSDCSGFAGALSDGCFLGFGNLHDCVLCCSWVEED